MNVERGRVLDGRYELLGRLGQGGIGEVWEAFDRATAAVVAVKMLHDFHRDATMEKRFAREAELLARVQSPFVCALRANGIDRSTMTPYLVVERLTGDPLDRALPRRRPLPFEEARRYTEEILRGLAAVHDAGIVHRDLKPGNVFLADDERGRRAVLIDFGIGKLLGGDGLTTKAATLGSPRFMAPEQLEGSANADERCDVYAAATVAFRMLVGKLPFDGDNPMQTLALKTTYDAPSLAERSGEAWPQGIERFFAAALARDPRARPRTGAACLAQWLEACRELAPPPRPTGMTRPVEADEIEADDPTPLLSRGRR
ncbi:MAG: serine/threonine-protein kinase [Labilithrix sp.]